MALASNLKRTNIDVYDSIDLVHLTDKLMQITDLFEKERQDTKSIMLRLERDHVDNRQKMKNLQDVVDNFSKKNQNNNVSSNKLKPGPKSSDPTVYNLFLKYVLGEIKKQNASNREYNYKIHFKQQTMNWTQRKIQFCMKFLENTKKEFETESKKIELNTEIDEYKKAELQQQLIVNFEKTAYAEFKAYIKERIIAKDSSLAIFEKSEY